MTTSTVTYNGKLRTTAIHLKSNTQIITDAPVDNHGKGEAFSPTDLLATSLASCMLTIMGIKAESMRLDINDSKAEVTKVMSSDPRRVAEIHVKITVTGARLGMLIKESLKTWQRLVPLLKAYTLILNRWLSSVLYNH